MKALVGDKAADMARLTALEGVAKAKRREIDTLQASFEAARSRGDAKAIPLEAQIISRAQPGSVPSFPKRLQLSALAAAATLLLGMVAAITRELVRSARLPTDPDAANQAVHRAPIPAMPDHETREYPVMVASLGIAARHLRTKVHVDRGHRTLVVGMAAAVDAREHGVELARLLAGPGARTVVIDWNADGRSIAETLGAHRHPGIAELLQGTASLHQAIQLLPGSTGLRFISPGGGLPNTAMHADQANLIFDAIDDAYDHIVFVGEYDALDALFTIVKGRFDTVVEISAPAHVQAARSAPGILFGFPVSGIEVLRLGVDARPQRRPATLARHSAEALS